jgi:hypothetical protein
MKKILTLLLLIHTLNSIKADEGMWMLPLIEKLNIQKMNGMGCSLSADEIYSEKNISLKDAVIIFGNGCTGVVVSPQGLVFTNHHCGFGAIQQLSSLDKNYLKNGFVAEKLSDEIPAKDLTVKFLVSITDVTDQVLTQLPLSESDSKYSNKKDSILSAIKKDFEKGTNYIANVKAFYSKNEYYVFVYEEFTDIRFAFAPPTSIGKFGGDTDNWMWPRHTGDFSVFRVYSDKNGKPAKYSKDNIPYSPKRFAAISTKGYKPNDYTMIIGNPGSTNRYLTSWGINNRMKAINQARIDIRDVKQNEWKKFMKQDEAINIAYASKYARSSNYWKNSIGMNKAILKLGIIDRKKAEEQVFNVWVNKNSDSKLKYGNVLANLENDYSTIFPYTHSLNYLRESLLNGIELPRIANQLSKITSKSITNDSIITEARELYKDYYEQVDKATFALMLSEFKKVNSKNLLSDIYKVIDKKHSGDYLKFTNHLFEKSVFANYEKFIKQLNKNKSAFQKDPALVFYTQISNAINKLQTDEYNKLITQIADNEHLYEAGLKEIAIENGTSRYPDANSTMRLTYGKVGGYKPNDAVDYKYYTTTNGILEKEIPNDTEFDVPANLKTAILDKNFGKYLDKNTGEMHVAFLSNNDITGGNSGSPIFNAQGELLGLAFDGNWEAMSGDIVFEPNLQRTINVDVRYMLFIMDKVAGAKRLVEELEVK